jgi:pSer/pThr/pTyr-binding forkhead associated (FHA) protein
MDIGRVEGDITFPEDRYLSPRHVRITRQLTPLGPRLILRDLGSTNGVYVRLRNQEPSAGSQSLSQVLADQDLFLVGQQVLRFEIVSDALSEAGLGPASQHGTLLFGTPAAPRYARLSQRTVEGVSRDVFYIRKAETVLGRESGDIVFTEDPFLSRRHAAVRVEDAQATNQGRRFLLADLGSSNGTFVQLRGELVLQSGDQFRIGQQLFRIDIA